jgi:hypothetical protein
MLRDPAAGSRQKTGEDDAVLYLWIGEAHELAVEDPRRARACYRRVLDLEKGGDLAGEARARLEKLIQEESAARPKQPGWDRAY